MGNGIFAMAMNPIHNRQSLFKISNFILIAFLQWSTNTIKLHFLFAVLHGTMSCVQWRFITSTVLWYWFNFVYSFLVLFFSLSRFFLSFFRSFFLCTGAFPQFPLAVAVILLYVLLVILWFRFLTILLFVVSAFFYLSLVCARSLFMNGEVS